MKLRLKPASHQSFAKRPERSWSRSVTAIPPTLSEMLAATTVTAMRSPRVSTIPKVLRPPTLLPLSRPRDNGNYAGSAVMPGAPAKVHVLAGESGWCP